MDKKDYAYKALMLRLGNEFAPEKNEIILPSGNDLCRIIYSGGRLAVSAKDEVRETLVNFLRSVDIAKEIRLPDFYKRVLKFIGRGGADFALEPSDAFIDPDKSYDGHHTLEYVCNKDMFRPVKSGVEVTALCRGDEKFSDDEGFSDKMYCVMSGVRICSVSRYRHNSGEFSGTCAMAVFTRSEFEGRGFAKAAASAATRDACENVGLALWVCQVENAASRRIAEKLGYEFLGGELRIY